MNCSCPKTPLPRGEPIRHIESWALSLVGVAVLSAIQLGILEPAWDDSVEILGEYIGQWSKLSMTVSCILIAALIVWPPLGRIQETRNKPWIRRRAVAVLQTVAAGVGVLYALGFFIGLAALAESSSRTETIPSFVGAMALTTVLGSWSCALSIRWIRSTKSSVTNSVQTPIGEES